MPSKTEYDSTLDKLAALLRRKPMTAREISKALKCCVPAAYERVQALRERGVTVFTRADRKVAGRTGPRSVAYGIR